jgi:hypothetical protein
VLLSAGRVLSAILSLHRKISPLCRPLYWPIYRDSAEIRGNHLTTAMDAILVHR